MRFWVATREAVVGLHEPKPLSLVASEAKADEERRESWALAEAEAIWRVLLAQVAAMFLLCTKSVTSCSRFTIQHRRESPDKGLFLGRV